MKKTILLLTAILFISLGLSAEERGEMGDLEYIITDDGELTISGTGEIPHYAFSNNLKIKTVILTEGVSSIGLFAFSNCENITTVTLPNSLKTIAWGAFEKNTRLTTMSIPFGVTNIDNYAFSNCISITAFDVDPANSAFSAQDGVLFNKDKAQLIICPATKSGAYTIPSSVATIKSYAFENCIELISITIPSSVTNIEEGVFDNCSGLSSILVDAGNSLFSSQNGVLFNKSKTQLILHPIAKKGNYTIPNSVTKISEKAFASCSLSSITIPGSVTSIEIKAFENSNITDMYVLRFTAPTCGRDVFSGFSFETSTLHVSSGYRSAYQTDPWTKFTKIQEFKAVNSISIDQTDITIGKNKTRQLKATVTPNDAQFKTISWSSNNPSVATVDENGVVTGITTGGATITATSDNGSIKANCAVRVIIPVTGIALDKQTITRPRNYSEQLVATLSPQDASNKKVTWTSSNKTVATVDQSGRYQTISSGETVITATSEDGGFTAKCTINVTIPIHGLYLSKSSMGLKVGGEEQLSVSFYPSDATNKKVTWASENKNIATVSSDGLVTAVAAGKTIVTVTSEDGGYTEKCEVSVGNTTYTIDKNGLLSITGEGDILEKAFYRNDSIKRVVVSEGITGIGNQAFADCFFLEHVTLPESLVSIGASSFSWCQELASITIPEKVTSIGKNAFRSCSKMQYIYSKSATPPVCGSNVFYGNHESCKLQVANNHIAAYREKEVWKDLTIIEYKPVTSLKLDKVSLEMEKYENIQLTPTVLPSEANQTIIWRSQDKSIASVYEGTVYSQGINGETIITAETSDGHLLATCSVKVSTPIQSIFLDKSKIDMNKGEDRLLIANFYPEDASKQTLTWKSSDEKVATVDNNGLVKAISRGEATITVATEDGRFSSNCSVRVLIPVSGIYFDKEEIVMYKGEVIDLITTIFPSDASNDYIIKNSSNKEVADWFFSNEIKAYSGGKTTITATTQDGEFIASCQVTVNVRVDKITLDKDRLDLKIGESYLLHAEISPSNATNRSVRWKSSNERIAVVSNEGLVTAIGPGMDSAARISVFSEESEHIFYNCFVFVTPPTDIKDIDMSQLAIYPNPTTDGFLVRGIYGSRPFVLNDMSGRTILVGMASEGETVPTSHLSSG
ncbi:Ig-like domain-containing protein, partial [Bacteroidales bacterium OttesenSCG-928-L03]|nr:Ig-like domain-containing protein [Bacteroidales bacterium OttesenSCG-928-L03]